MSKIKQLLIGASVLIAGILGAGWLWGYHKKKIRSLKDAALIADAKAHVAELDGKRAMLDEHSVANRLEITRIQNEKKKIVRAIVKLDHDIAEMKPNELEAAFRDMY